MIREGLTNKSIKQLKTIPKGDVHSHIGLGMKYETFNLRFGGKVNPPPETMDGIKGLDNYIFGETMDFITSKNELEFLFRATIEEAIKDGITVLESSIDCNNASYFSNYNDFFKLISSLELEYKDNIDFRPEVGIARCVPIHIWEERLIPCIDSGIFKSLDVYGDESHNYLNEYKYFYEYARKKGLKTKIHVGEFCDAAQIIETIEILDPMEIQHGINAIQSNKSMDMIKERNIRLNLCPTSNEKLGAVNDIKNYPIRKLFDKGIELTINTDDLLLFHSNVSQEFLKLYNLGILGVDELEHIRKNSLI